MQSFYVVKKYENGWKSMFAICFSTLEEAIAAREKLKFPTGARISNALPVYIGCGWFALDSKNIIA
jgi:hypothetical protein